MGADWEWKRNNGHRDQPLLEFYLEQLVMFSTLYINRAAHKRGDVVTRDRMLAIALAGADHEPDDA